VAKKVDKAVVKPIAKMVGASNKSRKKSSKSKTPRAKQAKKK
jgi:hypothetical protein